MWTSVHGDDADVPVSVNTLPASPAAVKLPTRCVVVPKLMAVAPVALYVLVMLAKVLLPLTVSVPAPPWLRVMLV